MNDLINLQNEILVEEKIKKLKTLSSKILAYSELKLDTKSNEVIKDNLKRELKYFKSSEIQGKSPHLDSFLDTFFLALTIYEFDTKENIEELRRKLFLQYTRD